MEAVKVLQAGDLERFGQLLNQSHESLRDDYEVSCREVDILVEIAREIDGTLGSRMTGAGFGGCTVSLVSTSALEQFRSTLLTGYAERTGIQADIYTSTAQDGARVETL